MNGRLTHVDSSGKSRMVDVGTKPVTKRRAIASGFVKLSESTIELIKQNGLKKGDCLGISKIAGIQAAKRTSELIPLCHPLSIDWVDISFDVHNDRIDIRSEAVIEAKTGIEMEALTAVSVAALTIYDMCKSIDKNIVISDIRLVSKQKQ
ncbi:MAG: molybdenum cofactor biosynthesis protein C [Candidatus Omnitrophica bacterium CG1_02_49_10]|nr:MAG: molybdenum cofactor biosynthesis protein C [Candidatus Omnitrophica bacterium CG1_02_49_10]